MKRIITALAAVAVAALGTFVVAAPAAAVETEPFPVQSDCIEGWYTNPDEGDRLPEQTEDGLFFEPADLVHHPAGFPLTELGDGGAFVADPTPDENFRFSVEILNPDLSGYATLHWSGSAWFIGGTSETAEDPADFIGYVHKWGAIAEDSVVISFGVGYTQTPPGEVETTVSSVMFRDVTYDLTCKPADPEPSESADPSPSDSATPTSATTTTSSPALAVTGSSLTTVLVAGVVLVAAGGVALVVARRRRA